MINVIVSGANGKMGSLVCSLIEKSEVFNLTAGYDPNLTNEQNRISSITNLPEADLVVDFCPADSILENCRYWIENYKYIIVGSSGLSEKDRGNLSSLLEEEQLLWIVPNFSIGAVLQKKWALEASKYYQHVLIEERHHTDKQDSPSGTSYDLALALGNMSTNKKLKESKSVEADDVTNIKSHKTIVNDIEIRSYRNNKYLAEQQVAMDSSYEHLLIDHSSYNREVFINGVELALNNYNKLSGLCVGLDLVME